MKLIDNITDRYLRYPISFDFGLALILWLCSKHLSFIHYKLVDKGNQVNILSNLVGTDISMAGFILASLTIIVTFKSNLKAKGIEDAENALELIFSSKHYDSIVTIFKKAIIELVICSLFIYVSWCSIDNLSIRSINRANIVGIFITAITITRSLYILFLILNLGNHKRQD